MDAELDRVSLYIQKTPSANISETHVCLKEKIIFFVLSLVQGTLESGL